MRAQTIKTSIGCVIAVLVLLFAAACTQATSNTGAVLTETPTSVTVPNVVGLQASAAKRKLLNAGFGVVSEKVASSTGPQGSVLSCTPKAGRSVPGGSTITITVASTEQ